MKKRNYSIPPNFRAAPERRAKLDRNRERDISEQIALGIPAKTSATGEGLFDARYILSSQIIPELLTDYDFSGCMNYIKQITPSMV